LFANEDFEILNYIEYKRIEEMHQDVSVKRNIWKGLIQITKLKWGDKFFDPNHKKYMAVMNATAKSFVSIVFAGKSMACVIVYDFVCLEIPKVCVLFKIVEMFS
jgi:hypothetical protein